MVAVRSKQVHKRDPNISVWNKTFWLFDCLCIKPYALLNGSVKHNHSLFATMEENHNLTLLTLKCKIHIVIIDSF